MSSVSLSVLHEESVSLSVLLLNQIALYGKLQWQQIILQCSFSLHLLLPDFGTDSTLLPAILCSICQFHFRFGSDWLFQIPASATASHKPHPIHQPCWSCLTLPHGIHPAPSGIGQLPAPDSSPAPGISVIPD